MDQFFEQQVFELNKARLQARQGGQAGSIIQPSYLRLDIPLQSGTGTYQFGINESQRPTQRASEIRLNQNNSFCVTRYGLYLINETPSKAGSAPLQSYPNIQVFPDEALYVANADLESVFNSFLNIKVGDIVFGNTLDLRESRTVRTTQQSTSTNKSEQLGDDGLMHLVPTITFDGSQQNSVTLVFPTWAGQLIQYDGTTVATQIYAVLRMKGFLLTNASALGQLNY